MEKNHRNQILLTLGLVLYFAVGYLGTNAFNASRDIFYTLPLPGEERIPFVAPFILGYTFVYVAILGMYFLIPNYQTFKRVALAFAVMMTIHYLIFVLFPVKMLWRPAASEIPGFFGWLAGLTFNIDQPFNCFPSLHVAFPTLATIITWKVAPKWRFAFLAMALITAVSVVLVKQHYAVDALGGAGVATLIGVFIPLKRGA